jgi:predicted MFS family arabinose efflux permease
MVFIAALLVLILITVTVQLVSDLPQLWLASSRYPPNRDVIGSVILEMSLFGVDAGALCGAFAGSSPPESCRL